MELKPTGGRGLTEVHGIKVGSQRLSERPTGCTVILVDGEGVPGGVSQRGGAPGTSETDLLHPLNMVDKVNAIVLAGGSAYGLDARIRRRALSRRTQDGLAGLHRCRPDRAVGDPVRPRGRQTAGRAADRRLRLQGGNRRERRRRSPKATSARAPARPSARWAAGGAMKGGLGSAAFTLPNGLVVAALVATNGVGDVIDPETGKVIAGARTADGKSLARRPQAPAQRRTLGQSAAPRAGENTTHRRRRHQRPAHQDGNQPRRADGRRWVRARDQSVAHDGRRRHGVRARDRTLGRARRASA